MVSLEGQQAWDVLPAAVSHGLLFVGGMTGIAAFAWVRIPRIRDLGMSFTEFIEQSERLQRAQRLERLLPPANRSLGIMTGVGGVSGLFGLAAYQDDLTLWLGSSAGTYPSMLAWYLILKSRAFFQPNFKEVSSADMRKMIIFFRSFDDEYTADFNAIRRIKWTVIDFPLESRLANYFYNYGPFVAIASRFRLHLKLGAARLRLEDNEWQSKVQEWLKAASTIVMLAGRTSGINWELNAVIQANRVDDLLIVFPDQAWWWDRGSRIEHADSRLEAIKSEFMDTRWSEALKGIEDARTIRAIAFSDSGDITVIRSRTRTRDSYHLAAMVAHFLQLKNRDAACANR